MVAAVAAGARSTLPISAATGQSSPPARAVAVRTQIAAFLGSRSPQALRRNGILLPFYQVLLFVPVILGLAALFVVPGLKDYNLRCSS